MYSIRIDTTEKDNKSVVLLGDNGKAIDSRTGNIDIIDSTRELMFANNIDSLNIKKFIYNKGPGSFTGLKIGATISNIFEWLVNKRTIKDLVYPEYGGDPNITEPKNKQVLTEE